MSYIGILITAIALGIVAYHFRAALGDAWKYLAAGVVGFLAGIPAVFKNRKDALLEATAKAQQKQTEKVLEKVEKEKKKLEKKKTEQAAEDPGPADEPNPHTVERFKDL